MLAAPALPADAGEQPKAARITLYLVAWAAETAALARRGKSVSHFESIKDYRTGLVNLGANSYTSPPLPRSPSHRSSGVRYA